MLPEQHVVAFALVHFTVGFVTVLVLVIALPITRYRLTSAYTAGIWALSPDLHHIVDGRLGERIHALHRSTRADVFFFHNTLDGAIFRAHNVELVFLSLVALGLVFVAYDRRYGGDRTSVHVLDATDESDETH